MGNVEVQLSIRYVHTCYFKPYYYTLQNPYSIAQKMCLKKGSKKAYLKKSEHFRFCPHLIPGLIHFEDLMQISRASVSLNFFLQTVAFSLFTIFFLEDSKDLILVAVDLIELLTALPRFHEIFSWYFVEKV